MEKNRKKIVKIQLIIILILLIIFLINTTRNYIIISGIFKKQVELGKITNFSYVKESYTESNENKKDTMELFHKDNVEKIINKNERLPMVSWMNTETGENIIILQNKKSGIVSNLAKSNTVSLPLIIQSEASNTLENRLIFSAFSIIMPDKIDGKKCYRISLNRI